MLNFNDPFVQLLLFVLGAFGIFLVYHFRNQVAAGARTAGGLAGGNFGTTIRDNRGYIASGGIVLISAAMLYLHFYQLWLICVAMCAFVVAVHKRSWKIGAVGLLALFLRLAPSIYFMGGALDWYNSFAPEEPALTAQELEENIPHFSGRRLQLASGESDSMYIRTAVQLPPISCHFYRILPDNGTLRVVQDNPENPLFMSVEPVQTGAWTYMDISLVRNTRPTRPDGCPAG